LLIWKNRWISFTSIYCVVVVPFSVIIEIHCSC
jgi:hypothetical protein